MAKRAESKSGTMLANAAGYGRPPRHTQFQKGRSDNPQGRPKGAQNVLTVINKAFAETVGVTERGRVRRYSKHELTAKQFANSSAKGDARAREQWLKFVLAALSAQASSHAKTPELAYVNQKALRELPTSELEMIQALLKKVMTFPEDEKPER